MKKTCIIFLSFLTAVLAAAGITAAQGKRQKGQPAATAGKGEVYEGPESYFTGRVTVQPIASETATSRNNVAFVTLDAGARSNWHNHDAGQTLVVTSGTAWTREGNGASRAARPGEAIHYPPKVKHFHGASQDVPMTHVSVVETINGKNVTWMEPVADDQYNEVGRALEDR